MCRNYKEKSLLDTHLNLFHQEIKRKIIYRNFCNKSLKKRVQLNNNNESLVNTINHSCQSNTYSCNKEHRLKAHLKTNNNNSKTQLI